MNIYDFVVKDINGKDFEMRNLKGKSFLVVNTATKCGLSGQLKDLEKLYNEYKDKGFEVLGFPCGQFANQEEKENGDIQNICQINYGVTFKMFSKIDVNGTNEEPLFKLLKKETKGLFGSKIKWNFTKFLVDRNGKVIKRYSPVKEVKNIKEDLEKII